jgi:N,N'-diacetyllegionaminate synthase
MSVLIIAEAGVNHNGSVSMAVELVELASSCGADAVKFQSFRADKLAAPGTEKAEYQKRQTGAGDQFEMLKSLEMSDAMHRHSLRRCQELGIEFMSTPFDEESLEYLVGLGMAKIKVPSGEITNLPFLREVARKDLPVILSTGMAGLEEVRVAVETISSERRRSGFTGDLRKMLTLLHCTSNYPARSADVNLRAMTTLSREFGVPVGYSDHTLGTEISVAAVALGASVIEKHITLDKALPGPDHKASLSPAELAELVRQIRSVESALGTGVKEPVPAEIPVRELVRRSVTLARDMARGETLQAADLVLLRPGTGIPPADLDKVPGRRLARDMACHSTLNWTDLA